MSSGKSRRDGRRPRHFKLPVLAIGIASVTVGLYVAILASEGDDSIASVAPFVALMVGGAALAALNLVALGERPAVYALAGVALVCVGVLGLPSIGLPFVIAGVLLLVSARRGT